MNDSNPISYAEFGDNFIRQVVTAERLQREIETLLLSTIEGRVHKLPADLLSASYRLAVNRLTVEPPTVPQPQLSYWLGLHGVLDLRIKFLSIPLRFSVHVTISILLRVHTYPPLTIRLLPEPVSAAAVQIDVNPHGIPEELLDKLNIIEPAVAEEIVSEVNRRITAPEIAAATTIDILRMAQEARLSTAPAETPVSEAAVEMVELTAASNPVKPA